MAVSFQKMSLRFTLFNNVKRKVRTFWLCDGATGHYAGFVPQQLCSSTYAPGRKKLALRLSRTWPWPRQMLAISQRPTPASSVAKNTGIATRQNHNVCGSRTIHTKRGEKTSLSSFQESKTRASVLERAAMDPNPGELSTRRWVLRTGHENVYLSWGRNSLIALVGGTSVYMQDQIPWAKEAAVGLFLLGGISFSIGTFGYIISTIALRKTMRLTLPFVIWNCTHASISLLLFSSIIAIYLGYVEEEPTTISIEDSHNM
ncbi:uncharacterized protein LOC100369275 [Saccoglossus kowalevskii]|uniref:Uncharacterized protein LOC100369275 n=1 Tax=Saccoglossus kowalevskii TaxID=10224 RepID=A0ABM0GQQ7_SACKO|nr:PREDICTED: uncharacterized protein LOC100369275 [Saccoglossus kowalevskii]